MDWISCCCETIICCCTICPNIIILISKCFKTQENNFTNPGNPHGGYIAEQPYSPQRYQLQQLGVQNPIALNSGLHPSVLFPENSYASNQRTAGEIASTNYSAPPPSYSEAVAMETLKTQYSNFPDRHIFKT